MSYASEKTRVGRQPCRIVEIDLDYCNQSYGVAPCAAAIGITGVDRCYNTRKTCQDPTDYSVGIKTYRFVDQIIHSADIAPYFPSLVDVKTTPAKIDPGKGLGLRSSVECEFQDHPYTDSGIDPYVALRSYVPINTGTFWGKFIARNPYYQGRFMRVKTGYLVNNVYNAANFETRLYVIDSIDGPDSRGKVRVVGKDILKLADDLRAQAPFPSVGKLLIDITAADTAVSLRPGDGAAYAASGYLCIGTEIVSFTRSVDALTLVRATYNSVAAIHKAGDSVQQCLAYTDAKLYDIVKDLLNTYVKIPLGYLDYTNWKAECDLWVANLTMTTLIPKPVGINTMLSELCVQGTMYCWWDERASLVKMRILHPVQGSPVVTLNDNDNLIQDSMNVKSDPAKRLSEVWVYYGVILFTDPLDNVGNTQKAVFTVDLSAEGVTQYNDQRVMKIYSRWLPPTSTAESQASIIGLRILNRYRDIPYTVSFQLDAKDSNLWTGDDATLSTRVIQSASGASPALNIQVLSVEETEQGTRYRYEAINSFFAGRYGFITPDLLNGSAFPRYIAATDAIRSRYGFISNAAGKMSDGTDGYKII